MRTFLVKQDNEVRTWIEDNEIHIRNAQAFDELSDYLGYVDLDDYQEITARLMFADRFLLVRPDPWNY